jgi:hypothetical protein
MNTYTHFGSRCRRNSPSVYRAKNIWDKKCRIERYTHFTCMTLSSPPVFEAIEHEGQDVYIFELLYIILDSSLPKIHEDYRFFYCFPLEFVGLHLHKCRFNVCRIKHAAVAPTLLQVKIFHRHQETSNAATQLRGDRISILFN